jgi:hypothetical protein
MKSNASLKSLSRIELIFALIFISYINILGQNQVSNEVTFVDFWNGLLSRHINQYLEYDSIEYKRFCNVYQVDPDHIQNQKNYATIGLLHSIITSSQSETCNRSGILEIPYYWHWGQDLPRRSIIWTHSGATLERTPPPREFARRYKSYADIDRTPDIFWQNLHTENPSFYTLTCDSFYTFGWCSEREMAYLAILHAIGFFSDKNNLNSPVGRIIAPGNHSWSEIISPFVQNDGQTRFVKFVIDNTYDRIEWSQIHIDEIERFRNYKGETDLQRWYNQKASSNEVIGRINAIRVSQTVQNRMTNQMSRFFKL